MSRVDDILAQVELVSMLPADCKVKPVGRDRLRGNCPIVDHRSFGTFSVARHPSGHQTFACYACNLRGSVIDLVAALDGTTVRQAIKKLSGNNLPELSKGAILQRAYDQIDRERPLYYLPCKEPGCFKVLHVFSEEDLCVLSAGGSWQWKVSRNGNVAECGLHDFVGEFTRRKIMKIFEPFIAELPIVIQLEDEIRRG